MGNAGQVGLTVISTFILSSTMATTGIGSTDGQFQ
jgi:hypothetical protein